MRTGIFGGSFDPVHLGHLLVADDVRTSQALDQVLFIPALHPPHKRRMLAPFSDRLSMLALALRDWPGLKLCDVEAGRPGPSYTVDTLRELKRSGKTGSLHLVIGRDQYEDMASWHEPEELTRLARLLVISRPGIPRPGLFSGHRPGRVRFLDVIAVDISAALIRSRLSCRKSVRYMLPSAVHSYVKTQRLYN